MDLRQKTELRKYLVPELSQSLNILALPLLDIKSLIEQELENNPILEETTPKDALKSERLPSSLGLDNTDFDFRASLITKKETLQDVLLRQLGMFTNTDEEFRIGQEIIGNIDENGFLKADLAQIALSLSVPQEEAEKVLKLIQDFEPAGVACRTVAECLLIQLKLANETDPLLLKIVECHLEDVARKNYSNIAKVLKEPPEKIEPLIKKIQKLDPKPGRNYSADETQHVIPDIIVQEKDEEFSISINNEDLPTLAISKDYQKMLKKDGLDPQTKEFLSEKMRNALELLRAVTRRQDTLRKIVEVVAEIQQDALHENLSLLKPLTFKEVAQRIAMHESTVCRAVMNKYVKTPYGVVALKDFFSSHVHGSNGDAVSSNLVKKLIKELTDAEDKKAPLSDEDIVKILLEKNNLKVARRTVTKYREELKILSSTYRRER